MKFNLLEFQNFFMIDTFLNQKKAESKFHSFYPRITMKIENLNFIRSRFFTALRCWKLDSSKFFLFINDIEFEIKSSIAL